MFVFMVCVYTYPSTEGEWMLVTPKLLLFIFVGMHNQKRHFFADNSQAIVAKSLELCNSMSMSVSNSIFEIFEIHAIRRCVFRWTQKRKIFVAISSFIDNLFL